MHVKSLPLYHDATMSMCLKSIALNLLNLGSGLIQGLENAKSSSAKSFSPIPRVNVSQSNLSIGDRFRGYGVVGGQEEVAALIAESVPPPTPGFRCTVHGRVVIVVPIPGGELSPDGGLWETGICHLGRLITIFPCCTHRRVA